MKNLKLVFNFACEKSSQVLHRNLEFKKDGSLIKQSMKMYDLVKQNDGINCVEISFDLDKNTEFVVYVFETNDSSSKQIVGHN